MKYAEIAFLTKTGQNSSTLTYAIPEKMEVNLGSLVTVGVRNKLRNGIVWNIHENKPAFKTLEIKEKNSPLLSEEQMKLAKWMERYYLCPLNKILKLFIPERIFNNKPYKRAKKPKNVQFSSTKEVELTEEQKEAIKRVKNDKENKFLIHGVTGSGKTEVYVRLAEHFLVQGKQALILVPEISLTPQTIEYFKTALKTSPAVFNSKRNEREKYDDWTQVKNKEKNLIIGSRSAIFAPFQNLGLIIVDEEHENSYKQDSSPRYSVHKVIDQIQQINPMIKAVFGSATPSIETTENLKENTIYLKNRIHGKKMPEVEIIDLREEFQKKNHSIFSDRLREELHQILKNKKQAILFINRRGSASSVVCRDCGYKCQCTTCLMPLTYHASTYSVGKLICHHCGIITSTPTNCPECQGINIRYLGIGTQRIEQDLLKEFPGIRVLRADKDTTSTKHGFEEIYQKFKNHEADVLVGTQMIAKGLHLPKVDLVGIILADIGLNIPSFTSSENNFQLMTQVAGRAGRSQTQGKVIIQTYNPDHIALTCTKEHNFDKFFNYERQQRALLHNPPYGKLAKLTIKNPSLTKCQKETEELENLIWKVARENNMATDLSINSFPAYILRFKNNYRHTILIKSTNKDHSLSELLAKLPQEYIINPNIQIDIDPINI